MVIQRFSAETDEDATHFLPMALLTQIAGLAYLAINFANCVVSMFPPQVRRDDQNFSPRRAYLQSR